MNLNQSTTNSNVPIFRSDEDNTECYKEVMISMCPFKLLPSSFINGKFDTYLCSVCSRRLIATELRKKKLKIKYDDKLIRDYSSQLEKNGEKICRPELDNPLNSLF